MCIYQPSFFDESERMTALSKLNDPLETLAAHVDFELFRPILSGVFPREEKTAGAKPYDVVFMFKILILQRLYKLSDQQAEYQITDRMSFTRFLGLRIGEAIPDYSTVWRFREALSEADAVKPLFERFNAQLAAKGLLPQAGIIIDASFVEVPRQRNSREENAQIKQGQIPTKWENQPDKLAQKDTDARWTKKNEQTHYGYKNHVRSDAETNLITNYTVTAASTHDSQGFDELVGPGDRNRELWGDSAYASEQTEAKLKRWAIKSHIHEKGTRAAALDKVQLRHNREKSKIRCLIEHVFGFMQNTMNGPELEYIGLERIKTGIGLTNLVYNLSRFVQLVRLNRVPATI